MEYKNDKLIVDEIIHDPHLCNHLVVRIADKYYMMLCLAGSGVVRESDLKPYVRKPDPAWVRGADHEYITHGLHKRGGYEVKLLRAATPEEFTALCAELKLSEDDISGVFDDTYGTIYGPEYAVTVRSRQIRVHNGIEIEHLIKSRGIQAASGSPGRVNIRVE